MREYITLVEDILKNGEEREDRTGVGTIGVFGRQMKFDISESFPLLTSKFTSFAGVATELLWFLSGSTNVAWLHEKGCHIWDQWADESGDLGPIYGSQWRNWEGVDQLQNVIYRIRSNPLSRRHIVSAWNVVDVESGEMALPPCHAFMQFYVGNGGKLSCHMYQRSADAVIGLPYNIASYALLTYIVASLTDLVPGELIISLGDAHIYKNHLVGVEEMLSRDHTAFPLPKLEVIKGVGDIGNFILDDFKLIGYQSWPFIKMDIAV